LNAQIERLTEAWAWARANSWFNEFLNADDLSGLNWRLERINSDIRKCITKLSSLLAWKICNERMEDHHRRHLVGWQQEVRKIGKGTGKHAPKHRRNAKQHLDKCREAIPAWIMPLHRVYETVPSSPGVFDLIIVDEASQCGFDALPLTYLGKKLLVVGDENQISPEAVGIDKNIVDHLMQTFLYDFEHRDSFDADGSLFAHCKRRFSRPIVLREHFRCMPEIIRFSNDLCYHATPLIPLKQYPPERLEPLKMTHVMNGYREGSNSRVINKPEAKTIVDTIVNCCNDDQYDGKTMGVIILQGQFQAALIENQLIKELDAEEIEKRRLICGNPYSFQGDERDVIFLSMVAAPNQRIGTFVSDADKRRFNVAASRAKEQMWLFHTPTLSDLSQHCLRRRILSFFINPAEISTIPINQDIDTLRRKALRSNRQIEKPPEPFESWFELDVALMIAARKYRVIPQYPVLETKRIDLVIEGTQARFAVECDGDYWHGPDQYDADMDRQRVLERCGWQFFRVRGSAFYLNPEAALEQLWERLEDLDIHPISDGPATENNKDDEAGSDDSTSNSNDEGKKDSSKKSNEPKKNHQNKKATGQESLFKSNDPALKQNMPKTIQEALSLKPAQIRSYIVEILKDRPNNSCVKKKLGKYLLRLFELRTWGEPRESFCRKVDASVSYMQRQGQIKIYKTSKNVRVKLL
jgi:very-short-patch-repair endonuclease